MAKTKTAAAQVDSATNPYFRKLTIGDKEYTLDFGFRSLCRAEEAFLREGRAVNLLFSLNVVTLNLVRLRDLFAAAVRTHHPELGYENAVDLIQMENLYVIANTVFDVLNAKSEARKLAEAKA